MTKNLHSRNHSASLKKGSYSHESSPLQSSKVKKDTNNCFQPSELDTQLKLTSANGIRKNNPRPLTTNVFINNLNVQINSNQQANKKKTGVPVPTAITNRKNSKQLSGLSQREEAALTEFKEVKTKPKAKAPQTSFDEALNSYMYGGTSYELRKNPFAIVPRHNSEASNDVTRSSYIPKFKGTDPHNKFNVRSPPKVFSHPEQASKIKKLNGRNQKSFDANSGAGPLGKYTPYLNSDLRPPTTANNSPRNKEAEFRTSDIENVNRTGSNPTVPKTFKTSGDKAVPTSKPAGKSPMIMKHRKTPSFDIGKRNENMAQKRMTPPILDKARKSADYGEAWHEGLEPFNKNKTSFQFAIRTRAGVAPNGTRKINQDSFIFHTNYGKKNDRYLLGVCDGHGMNGHFVSGFVKDTLPVFLMADPSFQSNPGIAFTNAFELCHQKLLVCDFDCKFSGTTAALLLIDGNRIITANAGDSRALMASYNNKTWGFTNLTIDHKPDSPQEAQRIMKMGGRIEPFKDMDGGFVGPSRVWLMNQEIPGLAMSRSIGDLVASSVGVSCIPEIKEFKINPTDRFLIVASDGVWEFIESIDVMKIIVPFYEQNNIEGACDYLLGVALKRWQEEEEVVVDDITLILVFF